MTSRWLKLKGKIRISTKGHYQAPELCIQVPKIYFLQGLGICTSSLKKSIESRVVTILRSRTD